MKPESRELVDVWLSDLLGLPAALLWQSGVTVGMHAGLGRHRGIVLFNRKDAVHVSLPDWCDRDLIDELVEIPPHELADPRFWKGYTHTQDCKVHGPQVHSYADSPLEEPRKVERVHASDIASWQDVLSRKKWEQSGFDGEVPVVFGIRHGHDIAAVAGLTSFRGVPSDLALLTHPRYRGKGYTVRVARAAAAYAVGSHQIARFRYDASHSRYAGIARSLGFEPYYEQLVVAPR